MFVNKRRLYDRKDVRGYYESDIDYFINNAVIINKLLDKELSKQYRNVSRYNSNSGKWVNGIFHKKDDNKLKVRVWNKEILVTDTGNIFILEEGGKIYEYEIRNEKVVCYYKDSGNIDSVVGIRELYDKYGDGGVWDDVYTIIVGKGLCEGGER